MSQSIGLGSSCSCIFEGINIKHIKGGINTSSREEQTVPLLYNSFLGRQGSYMELSKTAHVYILCLHIKMQAYKDDVYHTAGKVNQ